MRLWSRVLLAALLTGTTLYAASSPAVAAPGDGSAYAVDIDVTLTGSPRVDVGPLVTANANGPTSATGFNAGAPGIMNTGANLTSASRDAAGAVSSAVSMTGISLQTPRQGSIGTVVVNCQATSTAVSGGATLTGINLPGVSVSNQPSPNTVVSLPGPGAEEARLIFNEQVQNADGSLTVNALRIELGPAVGSGSITIGSARCGPAGVPSPDPIEIDPSSVPSAVLGFPYSQTLVASGGTGAKTFAVMSGATPPGITITPTTGALSGTPTSAGTFSFRVQATDTVGATGSRDYTLTVTRPTLVMSPDTLPDATAGTPYRVPITVSGGAGGQSVQLVSGSFPTGVVLLPDGNLAGTPVRVGSSTFTLRGTDQFGSTVDRTYTLVVRSAALTITPPDLANGTVGVPYTATLGTTGGVGPYIYEIVDGALPDGVGMTSSGQFVFTPEAPGTSTFTVRSTDARGSTATREYTITVVPPPLELGPTNLPDTVAGGSYSEDVSATGGVGPYTYAISSGDLPDGLSLTGGTISGSPTRVGTFTFTVEVEDADGRTTDRTYTVDVASADLTTTPTALPDGQVGTDYSAALTTTGGAAPYTYDVVAGTLPPGVVLAPGGALSGSPSASGTSSFDVRVTDDHGSTTTTSYSITVAAAPAATQTIDLDGLPASGQVRPGTSLVVTATASSGLDVTLSVTGGCTYDPVAGTITITAAQGTCSVLAEQAGNAAFEPASESRVLTIVLADAPGPGPDDSDGGATNGSDDASENGELPDTGVISTWWLAAGLLALVVGLVLTGAARSRPSGRRIAR